MVGLKRSLENGCPLRGTVDRLGDRWSVMVVVELEKAPARFNELRRRVTLHCAASSISARMLTVTLRALERDGLITRTIRSRRGIQVEYELTALGWSFLELARAAMAWTDRSQASIAAARERFDGDEREWAGMRLTG